MDLPAEVMGIDAGATLWKFVRGGSELSLRVTRAGDMATLERTLAEWKPEHLCATGGGSGPIAEALAGRSVTRVEEFDAWARGAPFLAKRSGVELPERYLLVSLGTGTSVLRVDADRVSRVAGTAIGGGTLVGLGRLLTGADRFEEIAALAARGDRRRVDLLVGDIYSDGGISLHPDLNASSFAKLESREPADLAHAVTGLVGENVGIICTIVARSAGIDTIVFGGNTLSNNPALEEVLGMVSLGLGFRATILEDGAFCGAIGAASSR